MKRRYNFSLWVGFLFVLAGLFSYIPIFAQFPLTRDFPWVNLLLLVAGGGLLAIGLMRSFRQPQLFRGKIFGSILTVLSVAGIGLFLHGVFYHARQIPPSPEAPRVGQKAPDFTLPDQNGNPVTLAGLLAAPLAPGQARASAVLLIFFRGTW
jgi:hypothetical protein